MAAKPIEGEKRMFMTGNEVVTYAALASKVDIMYGYPITPQNEIMHYWTRLAPKYDRKFLQTEDEISAGFTTLGGVMSGKRAFTATAGPGNTLMQEPMSMAEMMRIPAVFVIMQRGGPSTATVIYSQQEVTMTTFGGNGEGFRIVYSTSDHQELFDYTIKAFNVAWTHRLPTFVLGDGYQAKMRESVTIYDPETKGIKMVDTYPFVGTEKKGDDQEPNHLRNTYNTEEELYEVVMEFAKDYAKIAKQVVEHKTLEADDAEYLIVAHGVVSRAVIEAVKILRQAGIKAGMFRPITLRPFPTDAFVPLAGKAKKMLIVESALGQMARLVRDEIYGMSVPMETLYRPGIGITSDEIVQKVKAMQ